ncbi:YciI family protein [Pseudaestuariivita atlantica]|uniref:YCII-related domain-containing protein n=1 Tax=Pseudaestuariivita atlantica TaxID=1317121 RepID=A0A0L1JPA3_9RHOB|nr:YciI family protein [Pseudaestuariivita atlantica]KNG93600.1 hypothetical protein ATO11_10335 [Pseudaestuariivita atlantica]
MHYVVLFTDAPDADPDIRTTHMAAHLDFLERNADRVAAAGPLSDPAQAGRDGLWIVTADTPDLVTQLIHADPFWPTGLRASYAIIPWRRVFAAGSRLI